MKRSRKTRTRHRSRVTGHVALWALLFPIFLPAQSLAPRLDSIFVRYQGDAPGCVLGIDQGGAALVRRAWGQATIEQRVPNRVETIFEAGSVSKQVTAASIHLLAARGQLVMSSRTAARSPVMIRSASSGGTTERISATAAPTPGPGTSGA